MQTKNLGQNIVMIILGIIHFVCVYINKVNHLQEENWETQKYWGNGDSELFCIMQISIIMENYSLEHEANISKES